MSERESLTSAELKERAPALAARAAERLGAEPFWQSRFSSDPVQAAEAVGLELLLALADALEAEAPSRFTAHVRELRGRWVARGLSSRHLADHLESLLERLDEVATGGAPKLLRAGLSALRYEEGQVGAVEEVAPAAARLALETLDASLPGWQQGWTEAPGPTPGQLSRRWASFVVDAVALGRGDALAGYFAWLSGELTRRGLPARLAQDIRGALRYGFSAQQEAGAAAVEALDAAETRESPATS